MLLIAGLAWAAGLPVAESATLTEHMDVECRQPDPLSLVCDYRLIKPGSLRAAVAQIDTQIVDGDIIERYSQAGEATAVLILVDTSDPARQEVVAENGRQIAAIVASASPHHRLGLASFDSNLKVLCPIGSAPAAMQTCAQSLQAVGRTTELYRSVIEAADLIYAEPAKRRLIVLASDGLAEDFAYHHADAVAAARQRQVVISSIGYPRSVPQSVALQTLRKLSEETGGLYVQASHTDRSVPATFFASMLAAIDSGGTLRFGLRKFVDAGLAGPVDITLGFQTADQNFLVLVPVRLPTPELPAPAEPRAAAPPVSVTMERGSLAERASPAGPASTPADPAPPTWLWFAAPSAVLLIVLGGLVSYMLVHRRYQHDSAAPAAGHEPVPYAFLVLHDKDATRLMLARTPWRIGRGKNNDLRLDDNSVSRLHAEIRRNERGNFALHDLESLNGVFVNEKRVSVADLKEGDEIDIGDIRLTFTLHDEDYASQDPTLLVRTRTPI